MAPTLRIAAIACVCLAVLPTDTRAQRIRGVSWALVQEVMPEADRFDEAEGDPPVVLAWATADDGTEELVGYVFLTSDVPPEQYGYSGPIEALVGMRLDGTLTGVRVTSYRESYMSQMGDFLRRRGFQEQFRGKFIGDPFRVWGDVDGISRVSISVRALARGVRDSARRVASARAAMDADFAPAEPMADPVGMSWFELRRAGVVERFEVTEPREGSVGISVAYVGSDRLGEYFLGRVQYESALRSMARRGGADHILLYGLDGARLRLFEREGWSIAQGSDTAAIESGDIVTLGLPSGGVASGEATMVGVMLIKSELDIREPFTLIYDAGELGVHAVEYRTQAAQQLLAEAEATRARAEESGAAVPAAAGEPAPKPEAEGRSEAAAPPVTDAPVVDTAAPASTVTPLPGSSPEAIAAPVGADAASGGAGGEGAVVAGVESPTSDRDAGAAPLAGGAIDAPEGAPPAPEDPSATADPLQDFDFVVSEEESLLARALADTSWSRVGTMLAVLALATWAFFAKRRALRWLSLGVTFVVLGYVDGGFLSVSHITSGVWAGLGVYLRDLPLLLIVSFTVVTTLVWGRVFCGFLCPFGALQDFIDRIVPRSWKRPLPQRVHDRAVWVKYGILAVILLPALAGSQQSLYQYFEPFGTVFFLSPSPVYWSIAIAILLASVVIPRFYCRYACPLGAALALGSLLAPRRIGRVEQCGHCKVCEQRCPTGAIRGPEIDFKECVRCNACEVLLLEKAGVCRHDMDAIRPRLVQVRTATGEVADA